MSRYGVFRGTVTTSADPEELGRLKAVVPQVFGQLETEWAWPAQPNVSDIQPLDPGDPVWIMFEAGDLHKPVWLGTWMKVGAVLPPPPGSTADIAALQAQVTANLTLFNSKRYAQRSYAARTFR
ncbi:MAG TPA: phage baseplate assembly protein V [Gemmatimonadales bacterium]|nr:phage baseplate assembly protein V [Gemmatimonadales bacterium]